MNDWRAQAVGGMLRAKPPKWSGNVDRDFKSQRKTIKQNSVWGKYNFLSKFVKGYVLNKLVENSSLPGSWLQT